MGQFTSRRGRLKRTLFGFVAGTAMFALAACSTGGGDTTEGNGGEGTGSLDGAGQEIVVFMPSTATIYQSDFANSVRAEAEELNYEVTIFENKQDQTEQDQQVQQYLATGEVPAAFIWWPTNAQAGVNSSRLLSQVAPVFQTNQAVQPEGEEYITAYAGVRAYGIGESMAELTMDARTELRESGDLSSEEGNVLEFTFPAGYQSGIDRSDGFRDFSEDDPFNILQSEPNATGFDSQGTFTTASQVVPKFAGELDFVIAQNLSMAAGAVTALEQNGLTPGEDVIVVAGNDAGDKTPLLNGQVYGAVIQSPVIEGKLIVQTVARYVATGEVTDEEVYLEADPEAPALEATPPAAVTYMPNPPIRVEDIESFQFWGLSYEELGSQ